MLWSVSVVLAATCTQQVGTEYLGNDVTVPELTDGAAACCAACTRLSQCSFYTYEGGAHGRCHLKNGNAPDYSRPNASVVSGYPGADPPAPAPAGHSYHFSLGPKLSETSQHFVCWNIDASANRGFFWRNYSTATPFGAKLARQASSLGEGQAAGYSLLRFGGSGNDSLHVRCPHQTSAMKTTLQSYSLLRLAPCRWLRHSVSPCKRVHAVPQRDHLAGVTTPATGRRTPATANIAPAPPTQFKSTLHALIRHSLSTSRAQAAELH